MTVTGYTVKELKETIASIKEAYLKVLASGGVTSYTISSGQSSTTVQSASLSMLKEQLAYFQGLLKEELEYGSGSHCTFVRDGGFL